MTKDEAPTSPKDAALTLAKVCIQASLEYKRGSATAVEAVEDIDAMLAQPEEQQSWVSLTKEEIDSALSKYQNWYDFAAHLENILKEKNK